MPSSEDNPYVDAQGRTDAETFLMGCLDGSVVAGQKMTKLANIMLPRIRNGYKKWHYSVEHAIRPVRFIESFCMLPSGKLGVPFILEDYERMMIELMFGFVDDKGIRQYRFAFIEIARKNGKTSIGAALALYMLVAGGAGAPQCYFVASSRGQASIAFGHVWKMVRQSPKLKKKLRKGTVVERGESGIINESNMGYCIPLSRATDHLDGLDVFFALLDEVASWKSRDAYDLIRQGTSARVDPAPLIVSISTNGFIRDSIFDKELEKCNKWLDGEIEDDTLLPILFEQDSRDEIWSVDPSIFMKSNPGLGKVKDLPTLQSNINNAHNDPTFLPTLLIKDFNWPATSATSFLTYEEACNKTTYEFDPKRFRYCICGFDAADTLDLNAATALFMTPGDDHIYRRSMYWICSEQVEINSNNQTVRDGGVPYEEYAAKGYLTIVQGNKVPRTVFLDFLDELYADGLFCVGIGYDRWGFEEIEGKMKMAVGDKNVMPIAMGSKSLSIPMKQLKSEMRSGRIIDNNNPLDHMCNMNTTAKVDINGNVQPIKKTAATTRIDGFIALLCAYKYLMDNNEYYMTCIGA